MANLPKTTWEDSLLPKAQAVRFAEQYMAAHGIDWGAPIEFKVHHAPDGRVIQYDLYYETPEGEYHRLGKRGLIVSQGGRVRRAVRR